MSEPLTTEELSRLRRHYANDDTCHACDEYRNPDIPRLLATCDAQADDLLAALAERGIYSRGDLEMASPMASPTPEDTGSA